MPAKQIRLLLIEDDEDDYFLTSEALKAVDATDYDIVWCDTFEKGFDALAEQTMDVALVDYRIGDKNGIEFVSTARANDLDVPMILLTGLKDRAIDIAASKAGAADYLTKDEISPALLERAIRFACANAANQRSLAEHSALLQTTLDNIGSGVAALKDDGKLVAYNNRFYDLVRQSSPNFGPVAVRLASSELDWPAVEMVAGEILRMVTPSQCAHTELRTLDEHVLDITVNVTDEGGSVIVIQDITEQKLYEQRLTQAKDDAEAASRSKSMFLATVSHELRTPLNAIIGFSDLILNRGRDVSDLETQNQYMGFIHQSGHHLLGLIDEILEFTKTETGQRKLKKEQLDLKTELELCLQFVAAEAEQAGVELRADFADFDGRIVADSVALRRMVVNLLSNAIKFTTKSGQVTLAAKSGVDGAVSIAVIDTGIGIAEEVVPLIVQPFYQVDGDINRRFGGTGLGLAIVKALAQLHSAEMKIDSSLNVGTTVTIEFPPTAVKSAARERAQRQIA